MKRIAKYLCLSSITFLSLVAMGQTDSIRFKIVESLAEKIKRNYLSQEMAQQMCDTIKWKILNGKYAPELNDDEFAFELTRDLRRISRDIHIAVTPPQLVAFDENVESRKWLTIGSKKYNRYLAREEAKRKKQFQEMLSYGEIKILPGNIGYIEVKGFANDVTDKGINKKTLNLASIMKFLKSTDAIIVDLRNNDGGFFSQAARFCSYFTTDSNPYFITTQWHLWSDSGGIAHKQIHTIKYRTQNSVAHRIAPRKQIYLLASHRTFSSGETTAYKIKSYRPETLIVGEQTAGGGNGYSYPVYTDLFFAVIPDITVYDESNKNFSFEAKGISPDIMVRADSALDVAYQLALKNHSKPLTAKVKYLNKVPVTVSPYEQHFKKTYPDYVGDYRKIQVIEEGGQLIIVNDSRKRMVLVPNITDCFFTEDALSVKFYRDGSGKITQIEIKYPEQFIEKFTKQNSR